MSCTLLGVRIDTVTRPEASAIVRAALTHPKQIKIFTPNPEILVKADGDSYYKSILNRGDLNLCDGRGIQFFTPQKITRISGIDFMLDICALAANEGRSIFLLGTGKDDIIVETAKQLQITFPKLQIAGIDSGPEVREVDRGDVTVKESETISLLSKINIARPDILFVAFGMGKQEKWIAKFLDSLPSVKVAMGVGGAFDFISKNVPRAPLLLQKIGLEWLYRLWRQPQRLGRIFNATIHFCYLIARSKVL